MDRGCGGRERIIHLWRKARNLGWNREGSPHQYGNRRRGYEQDQRQVAKSSRCDDRRGGRDRRWPGKTGRGRKGPEPRGEMNVLDAANLGTGQSLVPRRCDKSKGLASTPACGVTKRAIGRRIALEIISGRINWRCTKPR